jgi:hypothetical protein
MHRHPLSDVASGSGMALNGSAFLALWNDVDPERDAEYNVWHTFEHVPERVGIAGVLSGRRYVARERSEDRYFTLYELEGLAALAGPEYVDVVEHPTAWSLSMRPSLRRFQRYPCSTLISLGAGIAGSIATFRFGLADAALNAARASVVLEPFLVIAGITSVHLGRTEADITFPIRNASTSDEAETASPFVLLVEGADRAALDGIATDIAEAVERGFGAHRTPVWKSFDLAYAIDRSSLPHPTTRRQPARCELRKRASSS